MNFKKTLGLVLTAALISSSLVAVKPVKAATTAAPVATTAQASSTVQSFSYFFAQKSLAFDGDKDSCVVSTAYTGQVQYEMWVKQVSDPNAKWQVVSADANGKAGYTTAVDGNNSIYTIPLVDGFSYKEGNYLVAVYAKAANTTGAKSFGVKVNADGIEDSNGTAQTCDVATSAKLRVMSKDSKQKYADVMSGDFMFNPTTLTVGQKATFTGFDSQTAGAKYKFMARKSGTDGSDIKNYTFVNDSFTSTVDWTPTDAGTYEVIAWSEPNVNKGGARDGWAISTVTVNAAATKAAVDPSSITLKTNLPVLGESLVTLKLTGVKDPSTCTVTFGSTPLKYYASTGVFSGVVGSNDENALKNVASYTVTDNSAPVAQATIDANSIALKTNLPVLGESLVTLKLTGVTDASKYAVTFGSTPLKYYASTGVFSGVVGSNDENVLKNVASYTVTAAQ